MSREVTITIIREIEIEVRVGLYDGSVQTLTDQGEPDEAWIIEATDGDGDAIELHESEAVEAVSKAWNHKPDDDADERIDDESDKPF